jgi:uncharacterized DUF497 family protein
MFEFDPDKAASNLAKHGVSFTDAEGVLCDPLAVTLEDESASGEQRFVTIGMGNAGEILVVVYTERDGTFRIISARRATLRERRDYEG